MLRSVFNGTFEAARNVTEGLTSLGLLLNQEVYTFIVYPRPSILDTEQTHVGNHSLYNGVVASIRLLSH